MQSHSAVCALACQTISWAGSSHCSTAAPLMCLWESACQALSNLSSQTHFQERREIQWLFPMKIKCFEEESVVKAVDILGMPQQTEPVGFLWEVCREGSDNLGFWDVSVCKPYLKKRWELLLSGCSFSLHRFSPIFFSQDTKIQGTYHMLSYAIYSAAQLI